MRASSIHSHNLVNNTRERRSRRRDVDLEITPGYNGTHVLIGETELVVNELPPLSADDVASFFLSVVDRGNGDTMTHLRLEKLTYYAQAWHLALAGPPLFPERIEAWELGPVVRELYEKYKDYDALPIPAPNSCPQTGAREGSILAQVWAAYGRYSAGELSRMTHEEAPWRSCMGATEPAQFESGYPGRGHEGLLPTPA